MRSRADPGRPSPTWSRVSCTTTGWTVCSACRAGTSSRLGPARPPRRVASSTSATRARRCTWRHAHSELTGETGVALVTRRPRCHEHGHRRRERVDQPHPAARVRRLPAAAAVEHGPAAGHPAHRDPRAGHPASRARCASPTRCCASSTRRGRARSATAASRARSTSRSPPTCCARRCPRRAVTTSTCAPSPAAARSPHPDDVAAVADLVARRAEARGDHRPGGTRVARRALVRFLDASGAAYLDTQEGRGLVPADHPAVGSARCGAVMRDADLVITVGRQLDYQLGFGSPAAFPNARFVRIADSAGELIRQPPRRGGDPRRRRQPTLDALADHTPATRPGATSCGPSTRSASTATGTASPRRPPATTGGCTPTTSSRRSSRTLDLTVADRRRRRRGPAVLRPPRRSRHRARYLDAGAFGCLGVGIPFAIAAALDNPDRPASPSPATARFGITAIDVNTAVRHGAKIVVIVSNNSAWNIERYDQAENYGLVVGTELDRQSDYAALGRSPRRARRAGHRPGQSSTRPSAAHWRTPPP